MAEIAQYTVGYVPDATGFASKLSRAIQGPSASIGQRAGSAFGKTFKTGLGIGAVVAVTQLAIGALSGLANQLGAYIGTAVQASDATDKFKGTLKFAGLNSKTIDSLTASTQAYADKTVYSLGDVQNITAQLAANGVKDYDKLAEAAGNLNAAAGGNADTYKSIGTVLTQTAGQGKLTTENFNQLSDAIPGASGKIQEALKKNGAYTGNFRKAMEDGSITADEFNKAVMGLGMTGAAKEAATSTKTIEGAIGNLQATTNGGLAKIITKLKPQITGIINGLTKNLGSLFNVVGPKIVSGVKAAINGVKAAIAFLRPIFATIKGYITPLIQALSPITAAFQNAFKPPSGASALATTISVIQTVMGTLVSVVSKIAPIIGGAIAGVISFVQILVSWRAVLIPIAVGIGAIMAAIKAYNIVMTIVRTATIAFTVVQTALNVIMALNPFVLIALAVIGLAAALIYAYKHSETFRAVVQAVFAAVKGFIVGAINVVKVVIRSLVSAFNATKAAVVGFVSAAIARFNAVRAGISAAVSAAKAAVVKAFTTIVTTVASKVSAVITKVQDLKGKIVSAFKSAGTMLLSVGGNIIDGLVNGIKNNASRVISAIGGVVTDTINGAKRLLGINSPSRVFFEIGGYTTQGLINGLDSAAVGKAARGLSNAMRTNFDGELASGGSMGSNGASMASRSASNRTIRATFILNGIETVVEGVLDDRNEFTASMGRMGSRR